MTVWILLLIPAVITQVACSDKSKYEECAKELKFTIDPETGVVSKDSDPSCLRKCMYQKQGSVDETGQIIIEKRHKILQPYLKKCQDEVKSTDPCKKIHEIDDCLDKDFNDVNKEIKKFCAAETKTAVKDEDSMLDFEDYERACFHKCVLQAVEMLDENGDISYADLITKGDYIFRGDFGKVIDKCESENTQEDLCVRSMKRINCFMADFD